MVGSFLGLRMAVAAVEMEAAMALAAAALAADDDEDDEEELYVAVAVAVADFLALVPTSSSLSLSSSSMAKDRELAIFFRFSARSFFRRDEASSSRSRCLFSPSVMTSLTSSRALRKSSAVTNPWKYMRGEGTNMSE